MPVFYVQGSVLESPAKQAVAIICAADSLDNEVLATLQVKEDLLNLRLQSGQVGVVPRGGRLVFCVVVKRKSTEESVAAVFSGTLLKLRSLCEQFGVSCVSCPSYDDAGTRRLSKQFVRDEFERVFGGASVSLTVWNNRRGNSDPAASLFGETVLAGDSNFLRVLGAPPQTRQGLVASNANIRSVRLAISAAQPSRKVVVMVGTNDLLHARGSARSVETSIRADLFSPPFYFK